MVSRTLILPISDHGSLIDLVLHPLVQVRGRSIVTLDHEFNRRRRFVGHAEDYFISIVELHTGCSGLLFNSLSTIFDTNVVLILSEPILLVSSMDSILSGQFVQLFEVFISNGSSHVGGSVLPVGNDYKKVRGWR